ncbi:MAG: haloacid dehalogenase [Meiothermus sp.]
MSAQVELSHILAPKPLRAVFFDMDDTLLKPRHPHPLPVFKTKHGLPLDQLVVEGIKTRSVEEQKAILEEFHALERELSAASELREGISELLAELKRQNLHLALITNNHRASTAMVLAKHRLCFDLVLTREDGKPKPAPDLLLRALEHFGLEKHQAIFVGDSWADQQAGLRAFFLATPDNADLAPRFESPHALHNALKQAKLL